MIDFKCYDCAKSYSVAEKHAGKSSQCKACGAKLIVPNIDSTTAKTLNPSPPQLPRKASATKDSQKSKINMAAVIAAALAVILLPVAYLVIQLSLIHI